MKEESFNLWSVLVPMLTFLLGFCISRFTMSKKEKVDYKVKLQEMSNSLSDTLDERYDEFVSALAAYVNKKGKPSFTDFFNISSTGERYFSAMTTICNSINTGCLDKKTIVNTYIPKIKELVEKTLPQHYEALQEISKKKNFAYSGKLEECNYKSIYEVYQRWCK